MSIFDKVSELKQKFMSFFISKKKLQALENYAACVPCQHRDYLTLIKRCMNDGQVGEQEATFLSYLVDKYEINFLHWSHRTQALKREMNQKSRQHYKPQAVQGFLFDLNKVTTTPSIPVELLNAKSQNRYGRRAF